MKEQIKQPQQASRTIQSKTKAANQASISQILQRFQDETLQRQELDDDELLQGKFETAQRQSIEEDELLQGKFKTVQRQELDDDELLQGKFETAQRQSIEEDELLQGKFDSNSSFNNTGLPDNLKTGVENLSGYSMDDVRVHYNSPKPAQLQALAYTQGTDIHVAPGQEKHLPHEAWHVIQQKQGRVQPTTQLQGININDNKGLEKEADRMPVLLKKNSSREKHINIDTQSNTVQKVLVTDVPNTNNFSSLTDLGIWWAMAAEYHFQQNLPANIPNTTNLNPLDYILSISDYLPGAAKPTQINVNAGDRVRMLVHGYDPNDVAGDHSVVVNGTEQDVNGIVDNINANIINRHVVTPLYCYMGDNPNHKNLLGRDNIGPGPMLSPTMGSVSLLNDMNNLKKLLLNAGKKNTWNKIINMEGNWISIENVTKLKLPFTNYQTSVNNNGAKDTRTIQHLIVLLTTIYNTVNVPYNNFANYLIAEAGTSGKGPSLWK